MTTHPKRRIGQHPDDPHRKKRSTSVGMSAVIMPLASRFRVIVIIAMALSGIALWAIPKIVIQNDLMFMLPEENGAKNHYLDAGELLGNGAVFFDGDEDTTIFGQYADRDYLYAKLKLIF